jgi:hypothetical protein
MPSPGSPSGYEGQWSGTTSQNRTMTFTVSSDQKVTAITIGYSFNGCSGTNTFPNVNAAIGATPTSAASFGWGSGSPEGPNFTQVLGSFNSTTSASGSVAFGSYTGCGNALAVWTAAKQ